MKQCSNVLLCLFFGCLLLSQAVYSQSPDARIGSGKTAETDPVLNPSATELYFTRPEHGNNQGRDNAADIWVRTRDASGDWNRAINPGSPINSYAADRLLSFSPDGDRLAVLRSGSAHEIEVLHRDGRSWARLARWQVPGTVGESKEIGYNITTGELVFAFGEGTDDLDLYLTILQPDGNWTTPVALPQLNTAANESRPFFAADGRTLYFFRESEGWYKQADRGQAAVITRVPILSNRFALGLDAGARQLPAVVSLPGEGQKAELRKMLIAEADFPDAGRVLNASANQLPLALSSGIVLNAQVLNEQNPSIFLRTDERPVDGSELGDLDQVGMPVGGLASESRVVGSDRRVEQMSDRIQEYEENLHDLSEERRRVIENERAVDSLAVATRTMERDTQPAGNRTRDQYAEELNELALMKAKFRKQQEDRRSGADRDAGSWESPTLTRPERKKFRQNEASPSRYGYSQSEEDEQRRREDSIYRAVQIRRGLSTTPKGNQRSRNWENEIQRDLPPVNSNPASEASRIDEEYERQLSELERLKAELARLEGQRGINEPASAVSPAGRQQAPPRYTPPADDGYGPTDRDWSTRSPEPTDYRQPRRTVYQAPTNAGDRQTTSYRGTDQVQVVGVTFIEKTAYIDGSGYGGLEEIYRIINSSRDVVEILVHTPIDMSPRHAQLLSEERALTIRNDLVRRGIADRHFRVIGYGNNLTGKGGERVEVR